MFRKCPGKEAASMIAVLIIDTASFINLRVFVIKSSDAPDLLLHFYEKHITCITL